MKALFSSIFVLAVALATSASAQLSFQGGRVGVSHFELHDYFIEPYDPSYSFSSYYKETELNFDLVYSADQFGLQAGGYLGNVNWPHPSPHHWQQYGVNLHGYYTSPNGNKFGGVIQYSRALNQTHSYYVAPLVGVESIIALGPFDLEASWVTRAFPREYPLSITAVQIHFPVNSQFELRAGYSHRQRQASRDPLEFYSVGLSYSPTGQPFTFELDYSTHHYWEAVMETIQLSARYTFGKGNTGRLFSDRRSGIGRLGF